MDIATKEAARKLFAHTRDDFVVYIQNLSTGDPSGQDVTTIQSELHRIAHTLSTWNELHDSHEATCVCFVNRCSNFADVLRQVADLVTIQDEQFPVVTMKMFNMLAMQIGRLTLDGHHGVDEYAMAFDRMAKEEDRRWQIGSQGQDDGRANLLFTLWTHMNRISEPGPECTFECLRAHAANP
ncbi:hypothetical protein N7457_003110 [Penicillium paradoxum]|uniref:uncharacterized protein n=1 Tax=Penicillium paradoxum TaxID=176176 RepID=UPI002546EB86|nr:uncharacterized protein N7457_003110 [Penicillium paradoxum]KAJ5788120.1 hypothetical protein N7457_003110 [Penicillium paradoxum]